MFALPILADDVPPELGTTQAIDQVLANVAQVANLAGIQWPAAVTHSIKDLVESQLTEHMTALYGADLGNALRGAPLITVDESSISYTTQAVGEITVYRAKPLIEELEAQAQGLGWFVYRAATTGSGCGLHLYDSSIIEYHLYAHHDLEDFTDQSYAEAIQREMGSEAEEITDEDIERMREEYSYWPSDVLKVFKGAEHLLTNRNSTPTCFSDDDARAWLLDNDHHPLASCVADALACTEMWREVGATEFGWDHSETIGIGALAFICWDDPDLLLECVAEYEQMEYSGGECEEAFAKLRITIGKQTRQDDLHAFVKEVVSYFKRWHHLERLMSHFPTLETEQP